MKLMMALKKQVANAQSNIQQAHAFIDKSESSNQKMGVIGWCMGGRWSLKTALLMPQDIDAAVIYYGSVTADEKQLEQLNMPIIGFFAGHDPIVPAKKVEAFRLAMDKLGKNLQVYSYADAEHGFANPSGTAYNAEAAEDAWGKTVEFLAKTLAQ